LLGEITFFCKIFKWNCCFIEFFNGSWNSVRKPRIKGLDCDYTNFVVKNEMIHLIKFSFLWGAMQSLHLINKAAIILVMFQLKTLKKRWLLGFWSRRNCFGNEKNGKALNPVYLDHVVIFCCLRFSLHICFLHHLTFMVKIREGFFVSLSNERH
jgi:hypothetical protein